MSTQDIFLHADIATVLKWTVGETQSFSLATLREIVRGEPGQEKLVARINEAMQSITVPVKKLPRGVTLTSSWRR